LNQGFYGVQQRSFYGSGIGQGFGGEFRPSCPNSRW
jgi:hypothetical protein